MDFKTMARLDFLERRIETLEEALKITQKLEPKRPVLKLPEKEPRKTG